MFEEIRAKINRELVEFFRSNHSFLTLHKISPFLANALKEFIVRDGKRIRPLLCIIGYRGFAKKSAPSLYRGALAMEFLHDFMLIHDDIIDKSDTRRGKPAFHALCNTHLLRFKKIKFSGQDLAIVAGDVLYALAIQVFLEIKENPLRKEKALRKFIETAMYTGSGEFIELILGAEDIASVKKRAVYNVYDYKTANYTFSCPLVIGAILAGANTKQLELLSQYGIFLGRAFQIKDDILGMFSEEEETGKSALTDLKEGKKTLLIWHAFRNGKKEIKQEISTLLGKKVIQRKDLIRMRILVKKSGALECAMNEIHTLRNQATNILEQTALKKNYKQALSLYAKKILELPLTLFPRYK